MTVPMHKLIYCKKGKLATVVVKVTPSSTGWGSLVWLLLRWWQPWPCCVSLLHPRDPFSLMWDNLSINIPLLPCLPVNHIMHGNLMLGQRRAKTSFLKLFFSFPSCRFGDICMDKNVLSCFRPWVYNPRIIFILWPFYTELQAIYNLTFHKWNHFRTQGYGLIWASGTLNLKCSSSPFVSEV